MKILLAYDNSKYAEKAKDRAAKLSEKLGAELSVIVVIPDYSCPIGEVPQETYDAIYKATAKKAEDDLHGLVDRLAAAGIQAKPILAKGHPAEQILDAAASLGADMIVLGSRGLHGVERFFLGSVSSKVAIHAACDVLIVK